MNTLLSRFAFVIFLFMLSGTSFAQLTGIKTIDNTLPPGGNNYVSFTAAITDLNTSGVGAGGVTFNVAATQTFTENPPEITATGTVANQIIFQKSGAGTNPKIIPLTPGTVASSTTLGNNGDGIVIINGGDFITFNGIDLQTDPTFTGVGMMEYGYYLKKASGTDACKNIIVSNCAVTLNKAAIYSFGVFVSNISGTTSVTVTSTDGRSENIKIYGNTITNSYGGIQLRGFAAATPFDFYDQAIDVGVDSANNISDYGGGASTAYGIYAIYQNNLKLANNTITSGSGTTTILYGIFTSTGTNSNVDIYNNTVTITGGGTTSTIYAINNAMGSTGTSNTVNMYNNTITGCSYPTATTGVMYLLYSTSTPNRINMYGNTVSGNTAPGTGAMYCIYESGAAVDSAKLYGNVVTNNTRSSTGSVYCVYSSPASTTNTEIFGNTVHGNSTAGGSVYSIYSAAGSTINVYENTVFDQSSTAGTTPVVYGIYITAGTATRVFNNFVSDLQTTTSTGANSIAGIFISGGTTVGAYYNTVFLNAASTSATTFGTSGIYASTTPTVDLRNNVVVNLSAPGPTGGATVAYRRSSATLTTYAAESNNNDFFVNTSAGVQRYFYAEGTGGGVTNPDSSIFSFKSRVAPRDASSVGENPPFLNVITPPYDLHINTTTPTQLESGGTPISTPIVITQDYDGNTRNATTPDIGADEFTGTGADLTSPSILYTPLGHTIAGTVQNLTATIADPSGVPTAGIGSPVAYWKINSTGVYAGATGTFVSANDFTFSLGAGTVTGDTVFYFVAAQDSANNVGVVPSNGAGGFTPNPPAASTPPTNPAWYVARPALAGGTYTVGTTSGQYQTLKAAFDAVNGSIVTGPVNLSVLSQGTIETAQAVLDPVSYASGPHAIVIKPAVGTQPTIAGTIPGSIIKFAGVDNVTIDGSNAVSGSTRDLTLVNSSPTLGTAVVWIGSLGTNAGATNITVKNTNIVAGRNDTTNTMCIYAGTVDTITSSNTGAHNNNLLIENNSFQRARFAIYSRGVPTTGIQTGLIIRNNKMGSDSAGFEITYRAVDIGNTDSAVVSGNEIFNMQQPLAFTVTGIHLDVNVSNAVLNGNFIYRLHQTNTGTFGAQGISLSSATGSANVTILNNMISDLVCDGGGTSSLSNPYGIRIAGGTNHKVYYNSVSLSGSFFNTTTSDLSAAFIVTVSTATGLDVRDNIFSNTMTGGAGTKCYGIYAVSTSTVFGTINNNDYYASGPNGVLGRQGTTDVVDLAAWRTFTGQDVNSVSGDPVFLNPLANLHINSGTSAAGNAGAAVAGVTTDFDGDTRNASTPDIGADEFAVVVLPPPVVSAIVRSTRVPVQNDSVVVTCTITDTLGITTANLLYASDGVAQTPVALTRTSGTPTSGSYRGVLPGAANQNGKRIEYQIQANSSSGQTTTTAVTATNSYFAGISPLSLTGVKSVGPNRILLYDNYYARVTGTVNGPNYQTTSISYFFQDAVGGMDLFKSGTITPALALGDSIIVLGRLDQFNGLTEITPDTVGVDIVVVATGRQVTPLSLTMAAFNANPELYESRLIKLAFIQRRDATPPWPNLGASANIVIYQSVVTDTVVMRIDSDTEIDGSPEPTYPVTIVGIAGQFSTAGVFNNGYQIQPRYLTDFTAPATPGWTAQNSGITNQFYSVKAVSPFVVWAAAVGGRVLRTVDGGTTWTSVGGGRIGAADIYNVAAVDGNTAFVTTTPSTTTYIFRTTNGGVQWDTVFAQAGGFIDAIHMYDANNGIALGDPVGATWVVLKTSNGGASWARIATEPAVVGGEAGTQNDLAVFGANAIWFGSSAGGRVYRSTDAGATWASSTVPGAAAATRVISVWFNDANYGIAGHYTTAGVYNAARTTDGGATWSAITVGAATTYNIAVGGSGAVDFWMARGTDVYRSTNRGATWTQSYTGAGTFYDVDFITSGSSTYGWGVKDNGNIVSAFFTITDVEDEVPEIPQTFTMMQNYPNPFNPTTTLRYALPKASHVTMKIYNMLGQEVATLRDEMQAVGFHDVVWNARNTTGTQIASGVYFYRIQATPLDGSDPFSSIKKMVMLK